MYPNVFQFKKRVDAKIVALEAKLKIKPYSDAFENFFHQTGESVFFRDGKITSYPFTHRVTTRHLCRSVVLRCHPCETKSLFVCI